MKPPKLGRAMKAPAGKVVQLSAALVERAAEGSRQSPRGRIVLPLHKSPRDPLQRMLNALQPGSYIQPHRHLSPPKAETIVVLRGSVMYVVFAKNGTVKEWICLAAGSEEFGIDTQPGVYHTFFALEEDTVLLEVKAGPYEESSDKDFAPWAPKEGTDHGKYLRDLMVTVRDAALQGIDMS